MEWVHCSYTESFNCTSLGTFCFVMLMKFLFDLLSQCILASTTLSSAPGGPFDSGATTAFLGSKPGFFWSSECICICLLVVFFPYLCLYHVTIQSIPVLVPCLYGAQKVTPGWAWGLCMGQKAPECLEISIKISMLYFFLLRNIPAVGLLHAEVRNPCESVFTPCVLIIKVLQVLFDCFDVSSFLSDAFWLPFWFRDKVRRKIAIYLWRVELAEKWVSSAQFWLEGCPCVITPAELLERKGSCISCNCYCHSSQKELSHFKLEEQDCSCCGAVMGLGTRSEG